MTTQTTICQFDDLRPKESPKRGASQLRVSNSSPITFEQQWRCPSSRHDDKIVRSGQLVASRWALPNYDRPVQLHHSNDEYGYIIGIALKSTVLTFRQSGSLVFEGHAVPGTIQITAPCESASAEFKSSCDVLHLRVPLRAVADYYEEACGHPYPGDLLHGDGRMFQDAAVMRLALALTTIGRGEPGFGNLYVDGISLAILARLLERRVARNMLDASSKGARRLPAWRLQRAIDYIESHLLEPIRLGDIAASSGLTRMHFASAFRATTGHSPHQYVLHRRLERAQALLLQPNKTIMDAALDSGFCSQAHFTTVFKRLVGDTPRCWRQNALERARSTEK
jgi:AraC-like DNA-binding protein